MTRITIKKKVWLECSKCKGTEFSISKIVNTFGKTWEEQVHAETLCHSGYGWELEDFDFICNKCGCKEVKVTWKPSKKELKQRQRSEKGKQMLGATFKTVAEIIKEERKKEGDITIWDEATMGKKK